MENLPIRLNKFIGETGFCSRREADALIAESRVTVNGTAAEMGMKVTYDDEVRIDGNLLREKNEKPVYLAFNKPPGIECTTNREVRDNIIDYINYPTRIFPIGRLDKASEGLIFLTNDGDIVNKILRARNNHEKEYIVTVDKPITPRFIDRMSNGIPILDTVTRKCFVEKIDKVTFRIILTQGLNRQIRRMCEYLGFEVISLKRIRIINIELDVPSGRFRELSDSEIESLNVLIEPSVKTEEASYLEDNDRAKGQIKPRTARASAPEKRNIVSRRTETRDIPVRSEEKEFKKPAPRKIASEGQPLLKRDTAEKPEARDSEKNDLAKPFVRREPAPRRSLPKQDRDEKFEIGATGKRDFQKPAKPAEQKKSFPENVPDEKPAARNIKTDFQKPEAKQSGARKIEFIKKDDPGYRKKGDY